MTAREALEQAAKICEKPRIWDAARGLVNVVPQCKEAAEEIRALAASLPEQPAEARAVALKCAEICEQYAREQRLDEFAEIGALRAAERIRSYAASLPQSEEKT